MSNDIEFSFLPRFGKKEGEKDAYIVFSLTRGQSDPLAICRYGSDALTIADALNALNLLKIPMFMNDDDLVLAYKASQCANEQVQDVSAIIAEIKLRGLDL